MESGQGSSSAFVDPVSVTNRGGRGRVVLICDHASNRLPEEFGTLGLDAGDMERHIAWDPGAMPVATMMSKLLDAPLIASNVSRLVIDCNRPLDAPDLIPTVSESTEIPGNAGLDDDARRRRIAMSHVPFHGAIANVVGGRIAKGEETWLVSIHSFTPVYRKVKRRFEIGILHDEDDRISTPMIEALKQEGHGISRDDGGFKVEDNRPYSPADRVYYTLERHGTSRGLPCVMIEIRNNEIETEEQQQEWAERLARVLKGIVPGESGPTVDTSVESA